MEETTVESSEVKYKCDPDQNPWDVKRLDDFLFYCCPECSDRSATKEKFINHALFLHPLVRLPILNRRMAIPLYNTIHTIWY
jgi:uncharacterized protein YlaI